MMEARQALAGAALSAFFAAVVILAASGGRVDRMTFADGRFYTEIARDLDAAPAELDPRVAAKGPALRYGRIGLPIAIWILAAGQPEALPYAQPAVMVLSAAAIGAAARLLLPDIGVAASLLPFIAIGLTLAITGGFVEPLAAAAAVWAVVFVRRSQWLPASAALTAAVLTRETVVVVVLGLIVWAVAKGHRRGAVFLALSIVPVVAWHAIVRARFGSWPMLDPYLATAGVQPVPFVSILKASVQEAWPARLTALAHLALAVPLIARWRRSALDAAAAGAALQVASVPPLTWSYLGDAYRTFALMELMALLVLGSVVIARRHPELVPA